MHVCMRMGIECGDFTAPVSDWVCGGFCGSESSAGEPTLQGTDEQGLLGNVPVRCWTFLHPIRSPPQWCPVLGGAEGKLRGGGV